MSLNSDGIPKNVETLDKPEETQEEEKIVDGVPPENPELTNLEVCNTSTVENTAPSVPSSPNDLLPPTLQERFLRIKKIVREAVSSHHTFMIYGKSRVIRECMLERGWCEKFYRKTINGDRPIIVDRRAQRSRGRNFAGEQQTGVDSSPVILLAGIGDLKDEQSERQLISKMLGNHTVDFLWNSGSEWAGWPSQENKTTVFNRFCRAAFTSKVGLCANVRQMHWYYEAGVANTLFPRCYNICQGDQMHAFIEDFRFTACLSLLKWLVDTINTDGENATRSPTGTIPIKALDFAIRRCTDYIGAQSHDDIDQEVERVWSHQWDQFISWYYKIIHGEAVFVCNNVPLNKYFLASRHILKKIRKYWQQLDMDGILNLWILKPGNKSRGRGIVLMNKLEDVVARLNPANKSDTRYVVQKYIEKPLLIYSTKFDIRQWFIVTCAQPLTLWMYRESYLRFCSQKFSLTNFHESIHLCNNAVQCKYKNCTDRDPALPADNMWDATTFKKFLKDQGHEDAWDQLIYPGMKQGLVGSLLASQEAMDRRKNSFELYGADFMVMEDFSVWLIEINSHPDMSNSTSVTTRLCRQVMKDTIKGKPMVAFSIDPTISLLVKSNVPVVIDFREDKNADTGLFELAYRQRMPTCQPYLGAALSLQGTRINACEKKPNLGESKMNLVAKSPAVTLAKKKPTAHSYIGPVIVDLIEELEIQLDQEFLAYCKLDSPKFGMTLPVTSAPPKLSSKMSLAPVKSSEALEKDPVVAKSAAPATNVANAKSKSPTLSRSLSKTAKASPRRISKTKHSASNPKAESSSTRQNLVSKIMELQRESASSSGGSKSGEKSSVLKKNDEKVFDSAMRNAANKYKKYGSAPLDVPPIPALPATRPPVTTRTSHSSSVKSKPRTHRRRSTQLKKSKVHRDVADMYAVGLGLTK